MILFLYSCVLFFFQCHRYVKLTVLFELWLTVIFDITDIIQHILWSGATVLRNS